MFSSPYIWGTASLRNHVFVDRRFIPAHTGNRLTANDAHVHYSGSSPHIRGTERHRPAASPDPAVHPRTYGEQITTIKTIPNNFGSSPHIRGTVYYLQSLLVSQRFIPAHTGNSCSVRSGPWRYAVHPRTYGEQWPRPAAQ